jgi:hypothetical protein
MLGFSQKEGFCGRIIVSAIACSMFCWVGTSPAKAQGDVEAEMIGYHQLCAKGDRTACIKLGILIGRNQQQNADWRRAHADWFWWEH